MTEKELEWGRQGHMVGGHSSSSVEECAPPLLSQYCEIWSVYSKGGDRKVGKAKGEVTLSKQQGVATDTGK